MYQETETRVDLYSALLYIVFVDLPFLLLNPICSVFSNLRIHGAIVA